MLDHTCSAEGRISLAMSYDIAPRVVTGELGAVYRNNSAILSIHFRYSSSVQIFQSRPRAVYMYISEKNARFKSETARPQPDSAAA
jgi:hypothetical protein